VTPEAPPPRSHFWSVALIVVGYTWIIRLLL
jgi:hypothetical protein